MNSAHSPYVSLVQQDNMPWKYGMKEKLFSACMQNSVWGGKGGEKTRRVRRYGGILCVIKDRLQYKVPNLKLTGKRLKIIHVRREMTGLERCHMEKEEREDGRMNVIRYWI